MDNQCPKCKHRVSDWQMASGKAIQINGLIFHISCIGDVTLKELEDQEIMHVIETQLLRPPGQIVH